MGTFDDESLDTLRQIAGQEIGLEPQFHRRISGQTISEMRRDAKQLGVDLGVIDPPAPKPRGGDGKFSSKQMSAAIREKAGRS